MFNPAWALKAQLSGDQVNTASTPTQSHGVFDHYPDSPLKEPREWLAREFRKGAGRIWQDDQWTDELCNTQPREWIVPVLQRWTFNPTRYRLSSNSHMVSFAPRTLPISLQIGPQPGRSRLLRSNAADVSRPVMHPDSFKVTEDHVRHLPVHRITRFYRIDILEIILTGPENYASWTRGMKLKLKACDAWVIVEKDLQPVPESSRFRTRWEQLNNTAWSLIVANVSRELRRDICAATAWDTRLTWYYLRERCERAAFTTAASMQGIHNLLRLDYEKCESLSEFLIKMLQYIQAIECNRRERESDEWLWCQLLLVKLGPRWEPWVSDLIRRVDEGNNAYALIGDLKRLLPAIEAEEVRRSRASHYPSQR